MKKIVYIINNFEIVNDEEVTRSIEAKNEEDSMFWRFVFDDIKCTPQAILDKFFMELRQFQIYGYELKFICNEIKK